MTPAAGINALLAGKPRPETKLQPAAARRNSVRGPTSSPSSTVASLSASTPSKSEACQLGPAPPRAAVVESDVPRSLPPSQSIRARISSTGKTESLGTESLGGSDQAWFAQHSACRYIAERTRRPRRSPQVPPHTKPDSRGVTLRTLTISRYAPLPTMRRSVEQVSSGLPTSTVATSNVVDDPETRQRRDTPSLASCSCHGYSSTSRLAP